MGISPFTESCSNDAMLVDKTIGNAYKVVRHVSEHIEYVKHVSAHMAEVYRLAGSIDAVDALVFQIEKIDTANENIGDIGVVADNILGVAAIYQNLVAILETYNKLPELVGIYTNLSAILAGLETVTGLDDRVLAIEVALPQKQASSDNLAILAEVVPGIAGLAVLAANTVEDVAAITGAVLESRTDTTGIDFVADDNDLSIDGDKLALRRNVKAYVDTVSSSVNLPVIQPGDAGKQLSVKDDESGFELSNSAGGGGIGDLMLLSVVS